jgi:hypothetical protein
MPLRVGTTKMEREYISGGRGQKSVVGLGLPPPREVGVS